MLALAILPWAWSQAALVEDAAQAIVIGRAPRHRDWVRRSSFVVTTGNPLTPGSEFKSQPSACSTLAIDDGDN